MALSRRWTVETGSSHVPRGTVYQDVKLRAWLDSQRNPYRRGTLADEQIEELDKVNGWWWS